MAAVTGCAEILVSPHLGMLLIGCGLAVRMAINTFKRSVVGRVHVAIGTGCPPAGMGAGVNREVLRVMVPCRRGPVARGVARNTGGREIGSRVDRIIRSSIIGGVAGVAIGRRAAIVAAGMTGHTGNGGMSAGEREGRRCVVERRRRPCGGCVTSRAGVTDIVRHVI